MTKLRNCQTDKLSVSVSSALIVVVGLLAASDGRGLCKAQEIDAVDTKGIYFDDNSGSFQLFLEPIVAGSNWWELNNVFERAVGAFEFEAVDFVAGQHTLVLGDTGFAGTAINLFNLHGYEADGVITTADRLNTSNVLLQFETETSSNFGNDAYFLDVTAFVNSQLQNGVSHFGFLITPADNQAFDAFLTNNGVRILTSNPTLFGDVNMDGVVNLLDVQPFVDLIASGQFQSEADINMDGDVNLLDVGGFVELLVGN